MSHPRPKELHSTGSQYFHVLSTSNKFLLPILLQPPYLVGWNMGQAAEGCFKKAQELEWSFQTPEGSNAALCWLNAGVKKTRDCSCWYHVSPGVSCHKDGCQPAVHSVLLHTQRSKSYTSFYTSQLLMNITLNIHPR